MLKSRLAECFAPCHVTVEDNLLRIAQEAINNAVTHANPDRIFVNLTFDIKRVQLSVRDDGRGIESRQRRPAMATSD